MLPRRGMERFGATAIPDKVLIAVKASAPAAAIALAIGRTSATLGESLTRSGRSVARRTAAVTAAAPAASVADLGPPLPTVGAPMFRSIPAVPGTPPRALTDPPVAPTQLP